MTRHPAQRAPHLRRLTCRDKNLYDLSLDGHLGSSRVPRLRAKGTRLQGAYSCPFRGRSRPAVRRRQRWLDGPSLSDPAERYRFTGRGVPLYRAPHGRHRAHALRASQCRASTMALACAWTSSSGGRARTADRLPLLRHQWVVILRSRKVPVYGGPPSGGTVSGAPRKRPPIVSASPQSET